MGGGVVNPHVLTKVKLHDLKESMANGFYPLKPSLKKNKKVYVLLKEAYIYHLQAVRHQSNTPIKSQICDSSNVTQSKAALRYLAIGTQKPPFKSRFPLEGQEFLAQGNI